MAAVTCMVLLDQWQKEFLDMGQLGQMVASDMYITSVPQHAKVNGVKAN
jgi:hypothetical protein